MSGSVDGFLVFEKSSAKQRRDGNGSSEEHTRVIGAAAMLFCRSKSVLLVIILIESVWSAEHPSLHGQASKTVSPSEHVHHHPTVSSDEEALNHTVDHSITAGVFRGEPTDDDPTAGLENGDGHSSKTPSSTLPERNTPHRSESPDPVVITSSETTGELFPPDSLRTSSSPKDFTRGISLVDDDFEVSPSERTSDTIIITRTTTAVEGSGDQEEPQPELSTLPEGSGNDDGRPASCPPCDDWQLTVLPGHAVPVGTNITLSCVQPNGSSLLRWYKTDGDDSSTQQLLHSFRGAEITLDIPAITQSGRYLCVLAEGPCCHRTLDVRVYELPNYRYHLVVIGVVAAVCLFACLLLGVCRNYKTRKYEVQLELKSVEADCVYKM